jgi:hypothetical protein
MKKISKVDAYQGMGDIDFKVMDQELETVFNSNQRNGRDMTHQFFLDGVGYLVLEIYWDDQLVQTLRFENKGTLTDVGQKAVDTLVNAERVLELIKTHLKVFADEGTAHFGYTRDENIVIREFAQTVLEDIESYENGYED